MSTPLAARNAEIVRRHAVDGEYFEHIAADYGITRERIRQIVRAAGVSVEESLEARKRARIGRRCDRSDGYVMVYRPGHDRAHPNGYVLEHIVVAEKMIGRALHVDECVHHENGDRADNRPENLRVLTFGEHARIHNQRWTKAALLDAMRWLALRVGHTPSTVEINDTDGPLYHTQFVHHFGSTGAAQKAAGLDPNRRGGVPGFAPSDPRERALTPLFRKQHGHLARYETLGAMLKDRHDGLPTAHEQEAA